MSETPSKFKTEAEWIHHLVERSAAADVLERELDRIRRMALTGTVTNWLKLSDEDKRRTFAIGIRESSLRKRAEEELHMLRLHLADKNTELSAAGAARVKAERELASANAEVARLKWHAEAMAKWLLAFANNVDSRRILAAYRAAYPKEGA